MTETVSNISKTSIVESRKGKDKTGKGKRSQSSSSKRSGLKLRRKDEQSTSESISNISQKIIIETRKGKVDKQKGKYEKKKEKVLECELSLKEKFDMKVLGTLIQYYSLAVEHFGSIGDDKKCQEYNENLNLLFKQMEVKKYMEEGKNIEHNVKKEELKKEMKSAEKK